MWKVLNDVETLFFSSVFRCNQWGIDPLVWRDAPSKAKRFLLFVSDLFLKLDDPQCAFSCVHTISPIQTGFLFKSIQASCISWDILVEPLLSKFFRTRSLHWGGHVNLAYIDFHNTLLCYYLGVQHVSNDAKRYKIKTALMIIQWSIQIIYI